MGKLYEKTKNWLLEKAEKEGQGKFIQQIGADKSTFSKVVQKDKNTYAETYLDWLERAGFEIIAPEEKQYTKDVHIANTRFVNTPENAPSPTSEDYMAVPLVAEAGAGHGKINTEYIEPEYLMVIKDHPAVMRRWDLIGYKIGPLDTSMLGTIDPEDIVIVDRQDIYSDPRPPGNVYLVQEPPPDFGKAVKRVVFEKKRGKIKVVFYSDNAAEHPPNTYDLEKDFEGEISRALIGRVCVNFSDMTKK